ncbi:MAG: outer membrane beta-barrel domain-containing protein [Deltaproteobacteria bacterium]|nr:outer membrane beta-barrel domain-containing protein [Deltaproteobacteria bacterium]
MQRTISRALVFGASAMCLTAAPALAAEDPGDEAPVEGETTTPPEEPGEEEPEDAVVKTDLDSLIRVVQQRPVLKSGRFELFLGGGLVAGDQFYRHYLATAHGRVHVSEWVSIGATYSKYFSEEAALLDTVTGDFEVFPELSRLQWYAGADVTVVALEGKFTFFDASIVYWDLYASIGGGVMKTSRGDDLKPAGLVGAGLRFYLTEWWTVAFELKDHIFFEKFNAGNELVNDVVGQVGFTFFIPFGFDYEYVK